MDDNRILELAEKKFFKSTFNLKWQVSEQDLLEFVHELIDPEECNNRMDVK